ncbi:gp53-like domain-containing protein, partial [Ralstonia mannitolilytica]|uniref:gp53-like domain-containing protein n=1 Tax=Ralstonia mannitolilytica TaxID=105219 RepID=UPI00292F77DB
TATFPIALPNACRAISLAANSSAAAIPVYNTLTSSAMNIGCWNTSGSRVAQTVSYIVVGN